MKTKVVTTSNVMALAEACTTVLNRAGGTPGMVLTEGFSGFGKTTAIGWISMRKKGIYIRMLSSMTATGLLDKIASEMMIDPGRTVNAKVEAIIGELSRNPRPIFLDEADYAIPEHGVVETRLMGAIRDIHDLSDVPVVLVGMSGIARRIRRYPQFAGRFAHHVQFQACTPADARLMADENCDVAVADDLVEALRQRAEGSARLFTIGLTAIEQLARKQNLKRVELADWPRGLPFFLADTSTKPLLQAA